MTRVHFSYIIELFFKCCKSIDWSNIEIPGRALFRYFLFMSLAEENLAFLEAVEKLKKMKAGDEKKAFAKEIVDTYGQYINLSSGAMKVCY